MRTLTDEQVEQVRDAPEGLAAIIGGEISRDWADHFGADYNAYTAALALLDAPEAEGWRPIETAPKDGTMVTLFPDFKGRVSQGRWFKGKRSGGRWATCPYNYVANPTHWMPLPNPPAHGQAEKEDK